MAASSWSTKSLRPTVRPVSQVVQVKLRLVSTLSEGWNPKGLTARFGGQELPDFCPNPEAESWGGRGAVRNLLKGL